MNRVLVIMSILAVIFGLSQGAAAAVFTDTWGDFLSNHANGWGQTFTPAKGTIAPEGTVVPQTVHLTGWTYGISSSGSGITAGQIYLAVFAATNPNNMSSANLLGVSTNSVDMRALFIAWDAESPGVTGGVGKRPVSWSFDNIALDKDTQYGLMFAQYYPPEQTPPAGAVRISGDLTIRISSAVELETGNPYTFGGFIRVNNTANDWDPDFVVTYDTTSLYPFNPVPAKGAVNVSVTPTLSWTGPNAYTPVGYNVYVDPYEPNLTVADATYYSHNQPGLTYPVSPALEYETTYYWRVEALEPNAVAPYEPIVHAGPVWTFRTELEAAQIITDPVSQTIAAGTAQVQFTVTASKADTYQWYKDDVALTPAPALYSGETTATLTIYDVQLADEGFYHCKVDNSLKAPDSSAPARLLTKRLAGWWKLDGIPDNYLIDSVQEEVPGAPTHIGTAGGFNLVSGKDGSAIELNGTTTRLVTISNSGSFFNFYPQGYSVSAWVKAPLPDPAHWGAYVCKQGFEPQRGFILTHDAAGNAVHTLRQSFNDLLSGVVVTDEQWHLVTGTYDAATGQGKIYVDGVLKNQATNTAVPSISDAQLIFGAENTTVTTAPFFGLLDDVRIWSYPLDKTAVADLYVSFNPGTVLCMEELPMDISGAEGTPDCVVDLFDLVAVAKQWLMCNRIPITSCFE